MDDTVNGIMSNQVNHNPDVRITCLPFGCSLAAHTLTGTELRNAPLPPTIKSRSRVGETFPSALVFHRHVIEVSAPRFPA